MKTILKNIFTQGDNATYSYVRIFLTPPLLVVFSYRLWTTNDSIENIGYAMAFGGFGLGCLAFISKFIEDGTIKGMIEKFKK